MRHIAANVAQLTVVETVLILFAEHLWSQTSQELGAFEMVCWWLCCCFGCCSGGFGGGNGITQMDGCVGGGAAGVVRLIKSLETSFDTMKCRVQ